MTLWIALSLAAWAVELPEIDAQSDGPARERTVAGDGADLALVFSGEQRGLVGPCGCSVRPRGGVARWREMVLAVQEADPSVPVLSLNPGRWLASTWEGGALDEEALLRNRWMLRGLASVPVDVYNLSRRDLPGLVTATTLAPQGLVSANLHTPGVEVSPFQVVQAGALKVAVTGITGEAVVYLQPEDSTLVPGVEAVRALLPELEAQADLVVVMVYDDPKAARDVARLPGVDVVVEAGGYHARYPALQESAVWVRSWDNGSKLGELRLWLTDGEVSRAALRELDLDDEISISREARRFEREAERAAR